MVSRQSVVSSLIDTKVPASASTVPFVHVRFSGAEKVPVTLVLGISITHPSRLDGLVLPSKRSNPSIRVSPRRQPAS